MNSNSVAAQDLRVAAEANSSQAANRTSPNILILGANFRGNLGDYAILEATCRLLERVSSDCRISVAHHGFTGVDRVRTKLCLEGLGDKCVSVGATPFARPDIACRMMRRLTGQDRTLGYWLYRKTRAQLRRDVSFRRSLQQAAQIVVGGGGNWHSPFLCALYLAQISLCLAAGKPVLYMPQSMSRSISEDIPVRLTRRILRHSSFLPMRENRSLSIARQLGLSSAVSVADTVFALSNSGDLVASPGRSDPYGGAVVVAFAAIKHRLTGDYAQRLKGVIDCIKRLGHSPVLLTTCEAIDCKYLDLFLRAFPEVPQQRPKTYLEAYEGFRKARLVITDRFHCMVFSIIGGTPVVPVMDVEKVEALAETVGSPVTARDEGMITDDLIGGALARSGAIRLAQSAYLSRAGTELASLEQHFSRVVNGGQQ